MGIVEFGVPKEICIYLKSECDIDIFVETGTYLGGTSRWASNNFDRVYTVENSKLIYQKTLNNLKNINNISSYFGNSVDFLKRMVSLTKPGERVLFWLDAHWSGGTTYGVDDECPILSEIKQINLMNYNDSFIFIDDARMFLSPPELPHKYMSWPDISSILDVLGGHRYTIVLDDVIISIPIKYKKVFVKYLQNDYYKLLSNKNSPYSVIVRQLYKLIVGSIVQILTKLKIRK